MFYSVQISEAVKFLYDFYYCYGNKTEYRLHNTENNNNGGALRINALLSLLFKMAAVHKPFVFPVTGNTLIRMCQDAYEEGHKSLTVVLRPRITIVVGDVDTTCKKPRAAVEENVTYDRSVRHTNPDKAVSRRAGSHRMYEDRRIGSDDEIGWGNVFNIRNINDKLNEVTEVTNDKEKIQAPLAALSERSSDTSEVDSDDDSGFVYKPSDERIRAYGMRVIFYIEYWTRIPCSLISSLVFIISIKFKTGSIVRIGRICDDRRNNTKAIISFTVTILFLLTTTIATIGFPILAIIPIIDIIHIR